MVAHHNSGGGGGSQLSSLTVLTADDIYDLGNTAVELVPTPGANHLLVPDNIIYHYLPGANPFAGTLGMLWQWGDDSFGSAADTQIDVTVTGAEQVAFHFPGVDLDNHRGDPNDIVNQPLQASGSPVPAITGPIATAGVHDAGTGYAVNDTGTINDGNPDAAYIVTTVDGSGGITGFTVTSPGDGYTVGQFANCDFVPGGGQPGAGANARAIVNSITGGVPGDGTIEVTVIYKIVGFTLA